MKPLLLLLLAGLAPAAQAQTAPADMAHRHALGLTASPRLDHFFTANRRLPLGLIYKQQLRPGRALRARIVGYYSDRDTSNFLRRVPTSNFLGYVEGPNVRTWELNAYVGYEWQKPLGRRFRYYYGAEIGGGVRRRATDYMYQFSVPIQTAFAVETIKATDYSWNLQMRPFLGCQYLISKSISIFIESAFLAQYQHRNTQYDKLVYFGVNNINTGEGNTKNNSLTAFWHPIQFVGLVALL